MGLGTLVAKHVDDINSDANTTDGIQGTAIDKSEIAGKIAKKEQGEFAEKAAEVAAGKPYMENYFGRAPRIVNEFQQCVLASRIQHVSPDVAAQTCAAVLKNDGLNR